MQVHIVPTDNKEGGQKKPKDHSLRTAKIGYVLESQQKTKKTLNSTSIPANILEGWHKDSPY